MSPAGLYLTGRIWRMVQLSDDAHGGAVYSGTVAYACVHCRLVEQRPSTLLLEQGIEVSSVARAYVRPATLDILERDEFEVTAPSGHSRAGQRWRVVGVNRPPIYPGDSRGYIVLSLERIEMTRQQQ